MSFDVCGGCGWLVNDEKERVYFVEITEEQYDDAEKVVCVDCDSTRRRSPFRWVGEPPGYYVTICGKIISKRTGREMKYDVDNYGYPVVRIYREGAKRVKIRVHRLVLNKWGPEKPGPKAVGRHKNDKKHINGLYNLAWGTVAENIADRVRNRGK